MLNDVQAKAKKKMDSAIEALRHELQTVRTGRASISILDDVRVDNYGQPSSLSQVATLSVPEGNLVVVQPWNPGQIPEIEADAILKGTHSGVDGVYSADPKLDPGATRYDEIPYIDVINKGLKVMDATAITFCMEKGLPIVVFDLLGDGNIRSLLQGRRVGTLVA